MPLEFDDRIEIARRCIETNPNNTEAWNLLILNAQASNSVHQCRDFYEKLVKQFPSRGEYWKAYLDKLIIERDYEAVEELFKRCLTNVLHVGLWRTYLNYVKETKYNTSTYRENMAKAYDFAISKVGLDYYSFPIWNEYISFITSVPSQRISSEVTRIQMVRKLFHKGVTTPMQNIEHLWNDYCHFEQVHSQAIAKRQIEDIKNDYYAAKDMATKIFPFIDSINNSSNRYQLWVDYIAFEKSNIMSIQNMGLLAERLIFVYQQALMSLGPRLELIVDETVFLEKIRTNILRQGDINLINKLTDEISRIYERTTKELMKDSLLIHFCHAKFEESCLRYSKAHSIYRDMLVKDSIGPVDLIYIQYWRFLRRVEGLNVARNVFIEACNDSRTTYRIYVAFAYMEYYCTKDKHVANKIFNLALDKFGDDCKDLVMAYLDFVLYLNDDGIIRTAFGRYFPDNIDLVKKYVHFESHVGDLAAIDKAESYRLTLYDNDDIVERINERYSVMDLKPDNICRNIPVDETPIVLPDNPPSSAYTEAYIPDTSQMLPYKPRQGLANASFHPVMGGFYPPIPSLEALSSLLPPPQFFTGPFVNVDRLLDFITSLPPIDTKNDFMSGLDELKKADNAAMSEMGDNKASADPFVDIYSSRHSKSLFKS